MSPRTLLLGLLILVAGATAWILMSEQAVEQSSSTAEVAEPEQNRQPGSAEPPQPSPPADQTTREVIDAPDVEPIDSVDFTAPAEGPNALLVRCVDRDTQQPLAGAVVYYLDQSSMSEETMWVALTSSESIAQVLTRFADRYQTDSKGEVKVPYSADLALAGRHDDRFVVESVWEHDPGAEIQLELYVQPKLPVEVVDERGAPVANASVVLRIKWEEWRMDMLRLDTDENGHAVFEDFDMFAQSWDEDSMYVAIGETLSKPVEAQVTAEAIEEGAAPIRLTMPPTGAIEVRVLDRNGELCGDDLIVRLSPYYADGEDEHGIGGDGLTAYATTQAGIARFDHVGLGMEVVAGAFMNGIVQPSEATGRGPTAVGETVLMDVEEDVSFPVLTGIVHFEGEPLAGEVVEVVLRNISPDGSWDDERNSELDAEGRFRTQVSEFEPEAEQRREILVRRAVDGVKYYAQTDVPPDFERGELDAGVFELIPEPLLLSGTVKNAAGDPVAGAEVSLQRRHEYGHGHHEYYWESLEVDTQSQADGSFSVTGVIPASDETLQLIVSHPHHLPSSLDVRVGQEGVAVVLEQAGTLSGSVIVDEGFPVEVLNVRIDYQGSLPEEVEESVYTYSNVDEDSQKFEFGQLPPGIVRLIIATDDEHELVVIDGVVIAINGEPDPRLQGIDLRGRVFAHTLAVLDEQGDPVADVVAVEQGIEGSWNWGWAGEVDVISTSPSVDLLLYANGYRTTEFKALSGKAEVRLRKGIEIVIRWSGKMPSIDGLSWGVVVSPASENEFSWIESSEVVFDDSREARLTVGSPGTYLLGATVHQEDGWNSYSMHTDSSQTIEVTESGNPVFRVSATQEDADKAKAWMEANASAELESLGYSNG